MCGTMRGQLITVLVSLLPELNPVPSDASSRFVQSEVERCQLFQIGSVSMSMQSFKIKGLNIMFC